MTNVTHDNGTAHVLFRLSIPAICNVRHADTGGRPGTKRNALLRWVCSALVTATFFAFFQAEALAKPPNVVFILADNVGC